MNKYAQDRNRIKSLPEHQKQCRDPQHTFRLFAKKGPGMYEHQCPKCLKVTYFTIPTNES